MNESSIRKEIPRQTLPGIPMALFLFAVIVGAFIALILTIQQIKETEQSTPVMILFWIALMIFSVFMLAGLFGVQPNQSVVLTLFGRYAGSVRQEGLRWVNPFLAKKRVSLRVRNFETAHLKVNDLEGNPIEIAAVVVWKIIDSAEALFQVDSYENYVNVQSEAALRNLATAYAYDSHEHDKCPCVATRMMSPPT